MKPTLIVEGKVRKVSTIHFFEETQPTALVEMEEGFQVKDITSNGISNLIIKGRYQPAIDDLNIELEESKQYLQELKDKIALEVIANTDIAKLTHRDLTELLKTLKNTVEEYHDHKGYIDGVAASIERIKNLESEVHSKDE